MIRETLLPIIKGKGGDVPMKRGKEDKIVIIRDEVSGQPKVQVDGLWTGKDRNRIGRMLLRAMRTAAYQERQSRKQADQANKPKVVDLIEQKRLEGLKAYWAAKKEKKLKEEEKKNVRGQQK